MTFGGRIGIRGYALERVRRHRDGRDMRCAIPEGMRSLVDADLALRGPVGAPVLSGTVHGQERHWTSGGRHGRAGCSASPRRPARPAPPAARRRPASPLRFDVQIDAPSTLRIDNDQARIVASADLTLRGTYDRPLLFGRADIERGEVRFEGRRYLVTRGSLDFTNPTRIQPFFDIEAETRVRVPGQTYRVTLRMAGHHRAAAAAVHLRIRRCRRSTS